MKVILKENVASVGQKGAVVNVKEGYAVNLLFPRKLAQPATPHALKEVETLQKQNIAKQASDIESLKKHLKILKNATVTLVAKINEKGHLFAAIGATDIQKALLDQKKIKLDEIYIKLPEPIKEAGKHTLTLGTDDHTVTLTLEITSEKK